MVVAAEQVWEASLESNRGLEDWDRIREPFKEFAQAINQEIKVRSLRGQKTEIRRADNPDVWRVLIHTAPYTGQSDGNGPSSFTPKIWNFYMGSYAEYSFAPEDGYEDYAYIPVYSEPYGGFETDTQFVAGIFPEDKCLLIPFDIARCGDVGTITALSRNILNKCAGIINTTDLEEYIRLADEKRRQDGEKKFVELLNRRRTARIREAEVNLQGIENYLTQIGEQIQRHIRDREMAVETLKIARFSRINDIKLKKEWDLILAHEFVKSVEVVGSEFRVKTKSLISKKLPDTSTRLLGEFTIRFYPESNAMPKIFCTSQHPFEGWEHPHIPASGQVCLGNMTEAVATYISKYEFAIATQILIRFLMEPWEDEDWGSKIWAWPVNSIDEGKTPRDAGSLCENCGHSLDSCECDFCEICGRDRECECSRCEYCGERYEDPFGNNIPECRCDRCSNCYIPLRMCIRNENCERCGDCENFIDDCTCSSTCVCDDCSNEVEEQGLFCDACLENGCNA